MKIFKLITLYILKVNEKLLFVHILSYTIHHKAVLFYFVLIFKVKTSPQRDL